MPTPPEHRILFTPGPTEVMPEILAHMSRPVIGHRGEEMQAILGEVIERGRRLFGAAAHELFVTGSSATGLWEAAIRNTVERRVLVPVCGAFSERFYEVAVGCGVEAERIDVEWGRPIDPGQVADTLKSGRFDAVAVVHNETSTGVVNPLQAIAEAVQSAPDVALLVDCVSSLAGMPVEVDRHGIDVALASVQKCLALPPGLAVCAVSARAMERSKRRTGKGYYFDFVRLKSAFDKKQPMATPSVNHIFALQAQLRRIEAETLEGRYARHRAMADETRAWAAARRFELFAAAEARSETVTCVANNRGIEVGAFVKRAAERGFSISNGYGRLKEKTFRIGHMGDHTLEGVRRLLQVLDVSLPEARA
ncbi:MAG TPA: alanine--glyoxylate aminotransferase family protein [Candidatus Polarisedimenticolia bacterium]|jgi:predicted phosphoserine aminotransferase|nr:alanine--glyoxylate aminotransferase family protein [Candidatus Polarisedimenticolia bacterium]